MSATLSEKKPSEEPRSDTPRPDTAEVLGRERRRRGTLEVPDHTMTRVIEGAFAHEAPRVSEPKVHLASVSDDAIDIAVEITMEYPNSPLSQVLAEIRRRVTEEISRVLGRSVSRLDITVTDLTVPVKRSGRRVL